MRSAVEAPKRLRLCSVLRKFDRKFKEKKIQQKSRRKEKMKENKNWFKVNKLFLYVTSNSFHLF